MTEEELKEAGSKIRLVVCDMDGTLLDSGKELSARSLDTIRAARRKGVSTTVCSGRVYSMLDVYVRKLELDVPFISSNGAAIVDPVSGTVVHQKLVPADDAERLFDFCARHGFDYCALGTGGGFFSRGSACIDRFTNYNRIAEAAGVPVMPLSFFDADHGNGLRHPIHKILIYRLGESDKALAERFLRDCEGLSFTYSEAALVDVLASGVDKGYGVRQLARARGLKKEEICVMGDYINDIPMFAEAGLSIAMGNGCDEVRALADVVTSANDSDGVAHAIDRYILQR